MATALFIDKLALVLVRDRKQLVARSRGKTAFFTPGGKREAGESDEAALRRECREELSVELIDGTIEPYGVFQAQAHGKPEGTMVEELRWIASDCPRADLSVTSLMILHDLKAKDLID